MIAAASPRGTSGIKRKAGAPCSNFTKPWLLLKPPNPRRGNSTLAQNTPLTPLRLPRSILPLAMTGEPLHSCRRMGSPRSVNSARDDKHTPSDRDFSLRSKPNEVVRRSQMTKEAIGILATEKFKKGKFSMEILNCKFTKF